MPFQGSVQVLLGLTVNERRAFVLSSWPPVGRFVTVYGQNVMAADTFLIRARPAPRSGATQKRDE
jgi:hypothetical protein